MKTVLSAMALFAASTGAALASNSPFPVSTPGTLALVGVAIAGALFVIRRKK